MAYTKPFTNTQKLEATNAYRSFRRNLRKLRAAFPPRNRIERRLLREYQDAIRVFGTHVSLPLAWIDPDRLNDLEISTRTAMLTYFAARNT